MYLFFITQIYSEHVCLIVTIPVGKLVIILPTSLLTSIQKRYSDHCCLNMTDPERKLSHSITYLCKGEMYSDHDCLNATIPTRRLVMVLPNSLSTPFYKGDVL